MMRAIQLAVACVAVLVVTSGQVQARILVVDSPASDPWLPEVRNKLTETGLLAGPVDIFNSKYGTPTLGTLQDYDSVLDFSDDNFQNTALLVNNLADFVDVGGGVVVMTFANAAAQTSSLSLGGRWATQNYDPLKPLSASQGTPLTLGTIYDASHPILNRVHTFPGGSSSFHGTGPLNLNAIPIADWSNGRIATLDTFPGRIASLNFYAPSSDSRSDFWTASTDGDILMVNALNYTSSNVSAVPEPSSLALFGIGACVAGIRAARRRRHEKPQEATA